MLIQKISYNSNMQKNNFKIQKGYSQNPNFLKSSIAFQGDQFQNENSGEEKSIFAEYQTKFKNLMTEYSKPKDYQSLANNSYRRAVDLELEDFEERNYQLETINKRFKMIDELLSKSSGQNYASDSAKIKAALERIKNGDSGKAFNRIGGYRDIKDRLTDEFVLKTMVMATTSQEKDVAVPNSIIIYGPTGTGKTTFAFALAEQSGAKLASVDEITIDEIEEGAVATPKTPEEMMDIIEDKAKKSLADYVESGPKKTRTILLVNEADQVANMNSPVLERFRKFVQTCSEQYKCTLLMTTNNLPDFDEELLSNKITPIKIPLMPADRKNCEQIIRHKLNLQKLPDENLEPMVDALFSFEHHKDFKAIFSNSDIINIIKKTVDRKGKEGKIPTVEDYIKTILRLDVPPSIYLHKLAIFKENHEILFNTLKNARSII